MNSDFKELLRIFNDHKVKYLVVGGYAVMKYTEPRYTKDLDIWISPDLENARAVFNSLREFGAPLTGLSEADFTQEGAFYQMGRPPARIDVLMSVDGLRFADAWANRLQANFDDTPAYLISRQDLMTNKRATGRPQDLIDVDNLALAEKVERKLKLDPPSEE